ncbi:MAG TPA: MBL fold metallo-hydrolase [Polyangiaceae bacterium]|jgi:glyoxylase-like metal-dependent hydrolase (beta-lactamase superfamily II)|nr:MBL fold metallo-hydrolase [Polyangiaceae bacterium]
MTQTSVNLGGEVTVHVQACGEDAIFVNAFLIETKNGVVAVDGTLTVSSGRSLRDRFASLQKPLLAVLVTHPHPDHVAGLAELVTDDQVPIIATQPVLDLMRRLEEPKRKQWGPVYGPEWVAKWRYPNTILDDGATIAFDGVTYRVHDLGFGGDSEANSIYTLSGPVRTAFLSDLVFNGVHSYLADGGVLAWLANLERVSELCAGMPQVFPGHGPEGAPGELVAKQREYLLSAARGVKELARGRRTLSEAEKSLLTERLRARWPGAGLEFLIGMSADAVAAELAGPR